MDIDPNLLLALVAVRSLGGRSVPASNEAVKALKKTLKEAIEKGWLQEEKVPDPTPAEPGQEGKAKKMAVIALTEEGEKVLQEAAHPDVLAATLNSHLTALRQRLDAETQALKNEVLAALTGQGKGKDKEEGKLAKELAKFSQVVADLAAKLDKLGAGTPQLEFQPLLGKIEQAFQTLHTKLERGLFSPKLPPPSPKAPKTAPPLKAEPPVVTEPEPVATLPSEPAPPPVSPTVVSPPVVKAPPMPPPAPPEPPTLATALRQAYVNLCRSRFPEGMVDLPSLFHEAKRERAGLTVEEFRKEIEALESTRSLDLHLPPDPRNVPEADKGIRRGNKLYYTIYWSPRP